MTGALRASRRVARICDRQPHLEAHSARLGFDAYVALVPIDRDAAGDAEAAHIRGSTASGGEYRRVINGRSSPAGLNVNRARIMLNQPWPAG